MDNQPDRYVVRLGGDGAKEMGFGDDLDEAIAYAADAAETNVDAEVWMMGTEDDPTLETRVWPEASGGAT
jgi:hypothetical protein